MKRPFVSVVIPVLHNLKGLRQCLESLERQSYPRDWFEVLVVDNATTPEVESMLPRNRFRARVLHAPRSGSYRARNLGVREARGSIFAFTDSDCLPDRTWIEGGVHALTSARNCGLVGGRIEVFAEHSSRPNPVEHYEMIDAFRQKRFIMKKNFSATANLFTSRETLKTVGLFNPALQSGGDVEWGRRVHRHGLQLLYGENVVVRHPARSTLAARMERDIRVAGGIYEREKRGRYRFSRFYLRLVADMVQDPARIVRLARGGGGLTRSFLLVAVDLYVRSVQTKEMLRRRMRVADSHPLWGKFQGKSAGHSQSGRISLEG